MCNKIFNPIDCDIDLISGVSLCEKSGVRYIHLSQNTTLESIKSLLQLLKMNKIPFEIYDKLYYPSTDPGAYLTYSQEKNMSPDCWSMTLGNHGWTGGIFTIDENIIASQLENLLKKGLIQEIRIEKIAFFSHYDFVKSDKNIEMNMRLAKLHNYCLSDSDSAVDQ